MLPESLWLLGRHLFFSSSTRIFLATLQLAYLIFMVCFTLIMQIICTIFLIIRSETAFIRSAVPIKIVIKRRAKQVERATRKQGEWESKEFRAAQGRKNHSAVVPAPENDMEKCRSDGTPKLFDRTVGVRTMQNGGQRNR